ncbi:MAG: hypothetical protein ACI4I2_00295 [Oscillospiraceae bacterium]
MKLRQTRYTPKKRRNPLLKALMAILVVLLLVMWLNMDRFGFKFSDMLIATGIALILLSIANANRKMEKDIEISDKQLEEMRDKIGKDEYSTSSMYFDEELK